MASGKAAAEFAGLIRVKLPDSRKQFGVHSVTRRAAMTIPAACPGLSTSLTATENRSFVSRA